MKKENKFREIPFDLEEASKYTVANQNRSDWTTAHNQDPNKQIGKKANATRKARGYFQSETHKEVAIKGGKIVGAWAVESGHLDKVRDLKKWTDGSLKRITCEVCGKDANTGNYAKWHGKKCKHNKIMEVFNRLPIEFTRKDVKQVIEELGAPKNFLRKIVNQNYLGMIECIHKGTNGSNKDVPRYKKISYE